MSFPSLYEQPIELEIIDEMTSSLSLQVGRRGGGKNARERTNNTSFVCRWAWRRGNRDSSGRVGPCTKYACRTIEEDTLGLACMLDRRSRAYFLAETAASVRMRMTMSRMCSERCTFRSNYEAPEVIRTPDSYATISYGKFVGSFIAVR